MHLGDFVRVELFSFSIFPKMKVLPVQYIAAYIRHRVYIGRKHPHLIYILLKRRKRHSDGFFPRTDTWNLLSRVSVNRSGKEAVC